MSLFYLLHEVLNNLRHFSVRVFFFLAKKMYLKDRLFYERRTCNMYSNLFEISIDVAHSALDLNAGKKNGRKQIVNISATELYETLLT